MAPTVPLPAELKPLISYINTVNLERPDEDELGTPERAAFWLRAQGLLADDAVLREGDAAELRELREWLRALALRNAGEEEPGLSARLPACGAQLNFRIADDAADLALRPAEAPGSLRAALAGFLAMVYRAQREGTWSRLKACRKESCLWAFYDQSKNHSGAWCSMAVCGNRVKAQRRRAKERPP